MGRVPVLTAAARRPVLGSPATMPPGPSSDVFTIERHGEITVIAANPALETIDSTLEEQVAEVLLGPLHGQDAPLLVFDLSAVNYFGSMFIAVLLRCWRRANSSGG